ncbi:PKD domain-containing protein [Deinococcus radiotolerans]|uniref:PKD domain-containing protein n=1 Tax=Deinococcus radiotolerans TaxID=1309407 RepID=A0ABQ2FLZ6_9DEIO|nr:PKD domain-containing protein [Deinococcus radiotolerans]GGL07931.1 hypothetical protein GCM10010844_28310 [Deinococcus radiotolerans]
MTLTSLPRGRAAPWALLRWLTLLALALASFASAQVSPTITFTPDQTRPGQPVTIDIAGLDPDVTYTIDLGNGIIEDRTGAATVQYTQTYFQPRTYTVSVSAPGITTAVQALNVTMPVPKLSAVPTGLSATLSIQDVLIGTYYRIEWGDGTDQNSYPEMDPLQVTHEYAQPGTYTILVSLSDSPGGTAPLATTTVTVAYATPILNVNLSAAAVQQPVTATLDNLVEALTYTLDWGDGTTDTVTGAVTAQKTHAYARPGAMTVTLSSASTAPAVSTVTVSVPVPTVTPASSGLTVTLNLSNLVPAYTYTLGWGDGTTETVTPTAATAQLTHTYAQPGTATIQLTPQDAPPITTTVSLTVPGATLTLDPTSGRTSDPVTATLGQLTPALTYTLDWGDGTTDTITGSTGTQKTHTYAQPGPYTVTLTSPGTTPVTAVTAASAPIPVLSAASSGLRATLNLGNLVPAYAYTLDWGDGTTETLTPTAATAQLTHTYAQPGTATIQVTPQGAPPVTTTVSLNAPNSALTITPSVIPLQQAVTATLGTLVPALTYTLDWGDGTTDPVTGSTGTQKTHTYAQPGPFTVTLTAPGVAPVTATLTVTVPVPTLNASVTDLTVTLNAGNLLSGHPYAVAWGDGATETLTPTAATAQLTHTYAQPGTVTIQVTPQGAPPVTTTVSLNAPNSALTITPSVIPLQQAVTARLSTLVPALTYTLDWGDGTTDTITGSTDAQKTHTYAQLGTFTVTLSAPGTAPSTANVTVTVPAPTASSVASGLGATLNLGNLVPAYAYTLDWGDGTTETLTPTAATAQLTHTYAQPGTATIQVTPQGGAPVTTTVTLTAPTPTLVLTPASPAVRQTVTATLGTLVPALTYTLDWGDGTTDPVTGSTGTQKTHTYAQPGPFTVTLTAPGVAPVTATLTVTVPVPVPTLSAAGSALTATLNLRALVPGYSYAVAWGDGATETLTPTAATAQLTHTYAQPGTVTIQLTPQGGAPVTTTVTLTLPTAGLNLSVQRLTVTAALTQLVTGQTYTLTWGDGTTDPITATGPSAQQTHTYAQPASVTVRLTAPGMTAVLASAQLSAPPVLTVTARDLTATATLTELIPTLTYTLDWGDGTLATVTGAAQATRTHTYAQPGTYLTRVTLSSGERADATVTVTAPVASLSLSPTDAALGQPVTATLSSLAPTLTYTLNWGDGTADTVTGVASTTRTHVFTAGQVATAGTFTVNLSAPGVTALTGTVTVTVPRPTLTFTQEQRVVTLTVGNLAPAPATYTVDWGDGSTQTVLSPGSTPLNLTHEYSRNGTYVVTVTPPAGGAAEQGTVTVNYQVPVPVLTFVHRDLQVTMTVSNLMRTVSGVDAYRVDWGDGTVETFQNPSGAASVGLVHTYARPGDFRVEVTPPSRGSASTPGVAVITVAVPLASLTVSPGAVAVRAPVTADVRGMFPGQTYTLNWGDGAEDTLSGSVDAQRTHAYATAGTYTVVLASSGLTVTSAPVSVGVPAPTGTAAATAPLTATVTLSGLLAGYDYVVTWGLGDAETFTAAATTAQLTHTYARPGVQGVAVTPAGSQNALLLSVTVVAPVPVLAVTPAVILGGDVTADLSNLMGGRFALDWGDGTTGQFVVAVGTTTAQQRHTYQTLGTFTLTLTSLDTAAVTATTRVTAPAPALNVAPAALLVRETVTAHLSTLVPALTYTVDWGDGTADTVTGSATAQKTHAYALPGTFTVTLRSEATAPVTATVTAALPVPTAQLTGTTRLTAVLTLGRLLSGDPYTVAWGDGTTDTLTPTGATAELSHAYDRPGTFTVTVSREGVAPVTADVLVSAPMPVLTVTPQEVQYVVNVIVGQTVTATLTDLVPALTYTLTWGGGASDTITGVASAQRTHVYLQEGLTAIRTQETQGQYASRDYQVNVTLPAPTFTVQSDRLNATATLSGLIPVVTYTLDWGDGSPVSTVTGDTTATLRHRYGAVDTYTVLLDHRGGRQAVTLSVPAGSLTVSAQGLLATAQLAGLEPELTYTLNWGDGATETLTGSETALKTHTYGLPTTFTVTLTAPRVPTTPIPVTTTAPAPALTLTGGGPALTVSADLTGLLPAVQYRVLWGDGTSETVTGQTAVTLPHTYRTFGTYTVTLNAQNQPKVDVPEVKAQVVVGLPPTEALQVTSVDARGGTYQFRITGLLPGLDYKIDFGNGTGANLQPVNGEATTFSVYQRSGPYVVTLSTWDSSFLAATRAVLPVQVKIRFELGRVALNLEQGGANAGSDNVTLPSTGDFTAKVRVPYVGGGRLNGRWLLDGQPVKTVTLDLTEDRDTAELLETFSEQRTGRHTLTFEYSSPDQPLTARAELTYALNAPTVLSFGDFKVNVKDVQALDPSRFSGRGTVLLIVGGKEAGTYDVTFTDLQTTQVFTSRDASETRVTLTPTPVTVNLGNSDLQLARLNNVTLRLGTLTLNEKGGTLSGTVILTDSGVQAASNTLTLTGAPLNAATGDLYAILNPSVPVAATLPEDGLTLSASAVTLDLSAAQSATELTAAFGTTGAPANDWMGLVFPAAKIKVGSPLLSTPVTLTQTAAYTAGGFQTTLNLGALNTTLLGWTVNVNALQLKVLSGRVSAAEGDGSIPLPLINESMPIKISWNPNAKSGERLTPAANGTVKTHVFGRTSLAPGEGVWTVTSSAGQASAARIVFANAQLNVFEGSSDKGYRVPLNNLSLDGAGNVTLNGRTWDTVSDARLPSLFAYPYSVTEVGVERQGDGSYTLGLKGRLQVNEQLPVNTTDTKTFFWVKDGRDVNVTTEAIHLTGQLAKVPFDITLKGALTSAGLLEFTGTGTLSVAGLLNMDAKAVFGRFSGTNFGYFKDGSGSVGYGSITVNARGNAQLGKPLLSAKRVEIYELLGGLTVNMDWPSGLDQAPAFRTAGPSTMFQAGALLSVKQDIDTPIKPYLKGVLTVDDVGTFDMRADAWLVKKGETLNQSTPNGRALVSISAPQLSVSGAGTAGSTTDSSADGRLLVQACVGSSSLSAPGGLNCAGVANLNLYDLMTLRGAMELYVPFSGSDQHLYIGTKASPITVQLPNMPQGKGYLMIDSTRVDVGAGVNWNLEYGNSGSLLLCSWSWNLKASAALDAAFGVQYSPVVLDGSVKFGATASASAGGCGINVSASASMTLEGAVHIAKDDRYFKGKVSASVSLPVIPDINISTDATVKF